MNLHTALWLVVAAILALAVAACGAGDNAGGPGAEVAEALGYQAAEGSADAPLEIGDLDDNPVVLHNGTVGNGELTGGLSYYLVQGATPGVDYTVTMTNLSDDADVFVYQGDPTFESTPADHAEPGNLTEAFTMAAGQDVTALYAVVNGDKTAKGATYTLSVTPKPLTEGTIDKHVDLYAVPVLRPGSTVGNDPDCCEVGWGQTGDANGTPDSYYKITLEDADFDPNDTVLVSLADLTADVDLYLSEDSDFSSYYCFSLREGAVPEACAYTIPAVPSWPVTLYIAVDGYYAPEGAAYTIHITDAPNGAGTPSAPCELGSAPGIWHQGNTSGLGDPENCGYPDSDATLFAMSVLAGGDPGITNISQYSGDVQGSNSYYKITGLIPGAQYRMTLDETTELADLYVFNKDNTFSTPVCKPPYADKKKQVCEFAASGTTLYVAVDGYYSLSGAVYKLSLFRELAAEGTADAPVDLSLDPDNPFPGPPSPLPAGSTWTSDTRTVGPDTILGIVGQDLRVLDPRLLERVRKGINGDSYYSIPVVNGQQYRVSLVSLSGDVNLYVYNDSTFNKPACSSYNGRLTNEKCYVTPTGDTLYIAVDGYFAKAGAAFRIQVFRQDNTGDNAPGNVVLDTGRPVGGAPYKWEGKVFGNGPQVPVDNPGSDIKSENSYYAVYVTPGTAYRVTLTGYKGDLDLYVRDMTGFPSFAGSSDATDNCTAETDLRGLETEICIANNGADTPLDKTDGSKLLLIGVDGSKGAANRVYPFVVVVEETRPYSGPGGPPITDFGTVTTKLEAKGSVSGSDERKGISYDEKSQDSFYQFDVTDPGVYRIMLTRLTQDANLYIFLDGNQWTTPLDREICRYTLRGQDLRTGEFLDEYCDVTVKSPPATLYFAVDGAYTYGKGANYIILLSKLK